MNKKTVGSKNTTDKLVRTIRRKTARRYSAEEKIRIVLVGLRSEENFAALCRREGIAESLYHKWSKEFLEATKGGISDADFALETTELANNQMLRQASTTMLAQANASKQNVLRLL